MRRFLFVAMCAASFAALMVAMTVAVPILSPVAAQNTPTTTEGSPFALTLEWQRCHSSWCDTGWYASPAVADLDEDGTPEVYWGGYSLMAVNGASGALEAALPVGGPRIWPSIVAADIDNDGATEIVIADGAGKVRVYGENLIGKLGWPATPFTTDREIRSLAVADLENDGKLEVIVCSTQGDNQWTVLEHNGDTRAGWPQMLDGDTMGYAHGCYNENVGVADIDGDGFKEIVGPNDTHYVAAFRRNGEPVLANALYGQVGGQNKPWARVGLHVDHAVDLRGYAECGIEHRPNMANSAPVIADLDGDGTREIIFVGNVYNCDADPYQSLYQMPFILNADRTRWHAGGFDWRVIPTPDGDSAPLSEDYNRIEMNVPNPVIADLDGEGFPEILYPSYDGRLHAWSLGKAEHGNWPYNVQPAGGEYLRFASEPVVVDLDNDGKAEVILNTWTENDSNQPGQLLILSHDGNLLQSIDLPWDAADGRGGALGAPTLANLDDDPNLEVVVGTLNRGLVAYEIANSANARILWGTGRGNYARTGAGADVAHVPQLALAKQVNPAVAEPGDSLIYTVTVRNEGTVSESVFITDTLPAQTELIESSVSNNAGTVARVGNALHWSIPLEPGNSAWLTYRVELSNSVPPLTVVSALATAGVGGVNFLSAQSVVLVTPKRMMLPAVQR